MTKFLPIPILCFALVLYALISQSVWVQREQVRKSIPAGYIIPSKFSRILSVGHQGLLSDFLFLKTATFIGGRSNEQQLMSDSDWTYVVRSLDVVTDLDPYFLDPYMLAEGLLAWDAQMPGEANKLLSKGVKFRHWDWRLPFFIGFNNFYFLRDYDTASGFIMQASQLPGSPTYLATLGARLAYYGGKSKTALLFLKEMLAETDDALLKNRLQIRLLALERAVIIEEALDRYKLREGRTPETLDDLVVAGDLSGLPPDPYGGRWFIAKNGRIFSTSKFAFAKPQGKE